MSTTLDEDALWGRPTDNRSCGDCIVCCKVLIIDTEGLKKPAGTLCQHSTGTGCGIYSDRPKVCRTFHCGWRRIPSMPDDTRPDRLGVMFSLARPFPAVNILRKLYIRAMALNSWDDFQSPLAQESIAMFRLGMTPLWLHFGDVMRLAHPSDAIGNVLINGHPSPTPQIAAEADKWRRMYEPM